MRAEFSLTIEDLAEASALTAQSWRQWRGLRQRRGVRLAPVILPIATYLAGNILMVVSCVYLALKVNLLWGLALALPTALVLPVIVALGGGARGRARRQFASDPRLADPRAVEWDEVGLRMFSTTWEHHIPWASVAGFGELPKLFMIYDADMTYVIPKRAFGGPEAEEQFRRAFEDHAPGALL